VCVCVSEKAQQLPLNVRVLINNRITNNIRAMQIERNNRLQKSAHRARER